MPLYAAANKCRMIFFLLKFGSDFYDYVLLYFPADLVGSVYGRTVVEEVHHHITKREKSNFYTTTDAEEMQCAKKERRKPKGSDFIFPSRPSCFLHARLTLTHQKQTKQQNDHIQTLDKLLKSRSFRSHELYWKLNAASSERTK